MTNGPRRLKFGRLWGCGLLSRSLYHQTSVPAHRTAPIIQGGVCPLCALCCKGQHEGYKRSTLDPACEI